MSAQEGVYGQSSFCVYMSIKFMIIAVEISLHWFEGIINNVKKHIQI